MKDERLDKLDTLTIICFGTGKDLSFALRTKMFECLLEHRQRQLVELCNVEESNTTSQSANLPGIDEAHELRELALTLHQLALIQLEERHDALVLTCLQDPLVYRVCPLRGRLPVDESFCICSYARSTFGFGCKLLFPCRLLVLHKVGQHLPY